MLLLSQNRTVGGGKKAVLQAAETFGDNHIAYN